MANSPVRGFLKRNKVSESILQELLLTGAFYYRLVGLGSLILALELVPRNFHRFVENN